nr:hypothetical protein SEVIR_3G261800v2 [Setaria viridis]
MYPMLLCFKSNTQFILDAHQLLFSAMLKYGCPRHVAR